MKKLFLLFLLGIQFIGFGQNITVDANIYTPQELVEDILVNSGCIGNVTVTNTVSGDFNNDSSFGYFDANGSNFPFENGIVMSTGSLLNVPGPNNNLSDDDAPNWGPDQDLEQVLGISNTLNATVIEFDFTPNANTVQFRYIFSSEEYQENNSNTCIYSDVFAFLIRPIGGSYTNIAVVPNTNTPVQVTTVHPEIPGSNGCPAENEQYFGSFNGNNHPTNFNGQTAPLVAQASVTPNTTYHIKLVIADEQNYRYDSAVFLEGNSFNIGAQLGPDLVGTSALCEDETYTLSVTENGNTPSLYEWFLVDDNGDETLLTSGSNVTDYTVDSPGTYKVKLTYSADCIAEDSVEIEYVDTSQFTDQTLSACDDNSDGITQYNLYLAEDDLAQSDPNFFVSNFFFTETEAENNSNPIPNPTSFTNSIANQEVFARLENQAGCNVVVGLTLTTNSNNIGPIYLVECNDFSTNTVSFNLNDAIPEIENQLGSNMISVEFYENTSDAYDNQNQLNTSYEVETDKLPKTITGYVSSSSSCVGFATIRLEKVDAPQLDDTYETPFICVNEGSTYHLNAGVLGNPADYTYLWENGETTSSIIISEPGDYSVTITNTETINGETYECSTSNTLTVEGSEIASIDYELTGSFNNYTVSIQASGIGDYVYSLNNQFGDYQESPVFNLEAGDYTIYVKDLNGCGIVLKQIRVIGYKKFFSPNQDGINDTWELLGTNRNNLKVKQVYIFDRFGKLLTSFDENGKWDGTYNGKSMPSTDYWFRIEFVDEPDFIANFTLRR